MHVQKLFLRKIFGGHMSFLWGHWYPCFGLLVMPALGFKARVDPLLVCFVACMQWIPQIHLWCDTCWPLDGQHGSWLRSLHATYVAEVGCRDSIRSKTLLNTDHHWPPCLYKIVSWLCQINRWKNVLTFFNFKNHKWSIYFFH